MRKYLLAFALLVAASSSADAAWTTATWYARGLKHPLALTAAHRTLPKGARVRVTYQGRSVVVRINDRGPYGWKGRDLDLSLGAARILGFVKMGVARVRYERI